MHTQTLRNSHSPLLPLPPLAMPPLRAGQRTTTEQRWSVIALRKDDRSERYIARKLGIARNTVSAIIARYNATGSPMSGSHTGRPRKTTEEQDMQISQFTRTFVPSLLRARSVAPSTSTCPPALSTVTCRRQGCSDASRGRSGTTVRER